MDFPFNKKGVPVPPPVDSQMHAELANSRSVTRNPTPTDAEVVGLRVTELAKRATGLASTLQARLAPISTVGERVPAATVTRTVTSPYFASLSSELDGIESALSDIGNVLDHLAI